VGSSPISSTPGQRAFCGGDDPSDREPHAHHVLDWHRSRLSTTVERVRTEDVSVRSATVDDLSFVQRMLYEAANRPGEEWPSFEESMEAPRNSRFWRQWLRQGDDAVIAEAVGRPIGAAWIRQFSGPELGPRDDADVPLLAIGVEADWRGRGVGGVLVEALLEAARASGVESIDLTVGSFNEAGLRLYRSAGFVETERVEARPGSYTIRMRAHLRSRRASST
jgi:ribosomal protein S18 acetylase RimI-like enzyme